MSDQARRVGLIVPSSNTTMETELPELFRRRGLTTGESFTWHSARARLSHVTAEELDRMVQASDVAAQSLADAPVEVIAYACLVAVMARGPGAHRDVQARLEGALEQSPRQPPVVTSAGALIDGLQAIGARRVAMITPYMRPLAELVADYVRAEEIEVADLVALEVSDNVEVGRIPSHVLVEQARRVCDRDDLDALVLSACVQMPSLEVVELVEGEVGIPVVTAATATARSILLALGLSPTVAGGGRMLAADVAATGAP
ncbi:Maleate cis-trans isomerase [Gaiella occulta]|uniref:Maleate isomerase n=1 Tax=Gaiella occulta TaxID=1002870 RepID=A0A7M2YX89_9ACTN|nr:Asp/Glu racemase [Gaiella occulta]RDI74751.1 Maleate cis-trans isomerase [Gaiella occulta]